MELPPSLIKKAPKTKILHRSIPFKKAKQMLVGRPVAKNEPLPPRDPMPSRDKLLAKAGLKAEKCLLGWTLNTWELLISLHTEKSTQWSASIKDIIKDSGENNQEYSGSHAQTFKSCHIYFTSSPPFS
jgi:hypothetical protein